MKYKVKSFPENDEERGGVQGLSQKEKESSEVTHSKIGQQN